MSGGVFLLYAVFVAHLAKVVFSVIIVPNAYIVSKGFHNG